MILDLVDLPTEEINTQIHIVNLRKNKYICSVDYSRSLKSKMKRNTNSNSVDSIEALLPDSSKQCILRAAQIVDANPELFEQMFELCCRDIPKVSARASRVIILLAEDNPALLTPYRGMLLDKLENMTNQSLMFNLLHLFILMDMPDDEEFLGRLTAICINLLDGTYERRAIKVYSMDILYRISMIYPEFKAELEHIIRKQMIDAYPALYSRGWKILRKLGCNPEEDE